MVLWEGSIVSDYTRGYIRVWKFVEPRCWLAVTEIAPIRHLLDPPKDCYPNRDNREAIVSLEHRYKEVLQSRNT